jgi:hypothetical protein
MASLRVSRFLDAAPICAVWLTGVTQSRVTASFIRNKVSATLAAICPVMFQTWMGAYRSAISPIAAIVEAATGPVGIGRVKKARNMCISLRTPEDQRKTVLESPTRPHHSTGPALRAPGPVTSNVIDSSFTELNSHSLGTDDHLFIAQARHFSTILD